MVYTVVNTSTTYTEDDSASVKGEQKSSGSGFWNLELELQAIKTILTSSSDWGAKVYASCKPEFFHHVTTKAVFGRVRSLMETSNTYEIPTLDFVLSDSKMTPSIRQALKESLNDSVGVVNSQGDHDILIQGLTTLAKTRSFYQATSKAVTELIDSEEPTNLIQQVTDQLGQSLFNLEDTDDLLSQLTMGKRYNQHAEDSFVRILNGSFEQQKIKTGFEEFDRRTGGFHRTNLVIIGAGSGGGKSLMAVNLLIRQYRLGYNTVLCSYEMTDDEVLIRVLSNISEVSMNKIQNNQLLPDESQQVTSAWREFNLQGYEQGNSYDIICPKSETTVAEIGFRVRSLKPDVLILDYINLLASSSKNEDAQWLKLGEISREAKILANKLNCVVVLLAQIDDTYNLRYSKAIKDHANFVMGWVRDETAKASNMVTVNQMKARNAPLYTFELATRFDIAQFRDPAQLDRTVWPSKDELMMLELRCQKLGLMPEPTVSREFDEKKKIEKTILANEVVIAEEKEVVKKERPRTKKDTRTPPDSVVPLDFSKLKVTASSSSSFLRDNLMYDDTV